MRRIDLGKPMLCNSDPFSTSLQIPTLRRLLCVKGGGWRNAKRPSRRTHSTPLTTRLLSSTSPRTAWNMSASHWLSWIMIGELQLGATLLLSATTVQESPMCEMVHDYLARWQSPRNVLEKTPSKRNVGVIKSERCWELEPWNQNGGQDENPRGCLLNTGSWFRGDSFPNKDGEIKGWSSFFFQRVNLMLVFWKHWG